MPKARQVHELIEVQWLEYDARTGGVAVSTSLAPATGPPSRRLPLRSELYRVAAQQHRPERVQHFGEVTIANNDLTGPTELAVEYGALRTGRLDGPQNLLRIGNGNCSIAFAGKASIDASYARCAWTQAPPSTCATTTLTSTLVRCRT